MLTFNAPKIYFIGNSLGYKCGANVIVSQKFEYHFVVLLLKRGIVIITPDFMIKIVEVYFEKYLTDTR